MKDERRKQRTRKRKERREKIAKNGIGRGVESEVNRHAGSPTAVSVTKHTLMIHGTKKTKQREVHKQIQSYAVCGCERAYMFK